MKAFPCAWTLAAPSFVWPAGVAENCARLQGLVDEVALLFLESEACLAYTEQDLPAWLASLDLSYHIHLPMDLPWSSGPDAVMRIVSGLAAKAAFLRPRSYVLHPPADPGAFEGFYRLWTGAGFRGSELLLENVEGDPLSRIWPQLSLTDCSVCLDLAHLLLYNQHPLLRKEGFRERLAMLHLSGEQPGHVHASLARMSENGRDLLRGLLPALPASAVVVLETFTPRELHESLDIFSTWVRNWGLG